jgi:L-aspartate oxidase
MPDRLTAIPLASRFEPDSHGTLDVIDITNSLRSMMARNMGVIREHPGLEDAQRDVAFWCRYCLEREFTQRAGWELQNLLTIARLMIHSALVREESRGVHFRGDFPGPDDAKWQRHIVCPALDELFDTR